MSEPKKFSEVVLLAFLFALLMATTAPPAYAQIVDAQAMEETFPDPASTPEFEPITVGKPNQLFTEYHIEASIARKLKQMNRSGVPVAPMTEIVVPRVPGTGPVQVNICSPDISAPFRSITIACPVSGIVLRGGG